MSTLKGKAKGYSLELITSLRKEKKSLRAQKVKIIS